MSFYLYHGVTWYLYQLGVDYPHRDECKTILPPLYYSFYYSCIFSGVFPGYYYCKYPVCWDLQDQILSIPDIFLDIFLDFLKDFMNAWRIKM